MKKNPNKKEFVKKFKKPIVLDSVLISKLTNKDIKKQATIQGLVEKIIQTGGPTIFEVADGTGILPLKAFLGAGERAYETVSEGDYIKAIVTIDEFNDELEGNIIKLFKKEGEAKEKLKQDIENRLRRRAQVDPSIDFLVKSPILDKLKEKIVKAATEIRFAILQHRPIIVRHHNDTDGYSSGFTLERAIIPLIKEEYGNPKAPWEHFMRAPCAAPYYEIDDSIKDVSNSLRNAAKFSSKMPLIIIADNGSTEQDLMGIEHAKVHGCDVIVIDHHAYEKDVISPLVVEHINPFLVNESGSSFSAGMLCSEIARFINPKVGNISQIPALAGLADRIDLENKEVVDQYIDIAKNEGYSRELLDNLSLVIEYVSTRLRFMEAREYIEVVFGEPRDQQKKLVELMSPYIKEMDKKGLSMAKNNAQISEINGTTIQKIMIEETFPGFGFFPKPGRSVGLVHDSLKNEGKSKLVSVGIMNTAMTFRATDEANFSVHDLMEFLRQKLPNAFVEGGGHKNAGSINYLPKFKEDVMNLFEEFMKNR